MEEDFCLTFFDALPDLLTIAKRRSEFWKLLWLIDRYRLQDKLRERYRRRKIAFRYSMPVRSFGRCDQCNKRFTEIHYELENPRGLSAETQKMFLKESQIHAIRIHGGSFAEAQRAFFRGLDYPENA